MNAVCIHCGAVMGDEAKHYSWHADDDRYDATLAAAIRDLVNVMQRFNTGLEEARRAHVVG